MGEVWHKKIQFQAAKWVVKYKAFLNFTLKDTPCIGTLALLVVAKHPTKLQKIKHDQITYRYNK